MSTVLLNKEDNIQTLHTSLLLYENEECYRARENKKYVKQKEV